jgi:hypothetical protein
MSKKVLIINYSFPPNPGIGGRRWAKFTKYFFLKGVDLFVFKYQNNFSRKSQWENDILLLKDANRVINVKNRYPKVLNKESLSIYDKLSYKISLFYVKIKLQGSFYDQSAMWASNLIPELEKKIKIGYLNIIASAAPYRYLVDLLDLKVKYPNITLIADFRDPWTNNTIAYGYKELTFKRFSQEKKYEKKVFQNFDKLVSPYVEHINYIKSINKNAETYCIPNGFDLDDLKIDFFNDNKLKKI